MVFKTVIQKLSNSSLEKVSYLSITAEKNFFAYKIFCSLLVTFKEKTMDLMRFFLKNTLI